MKLRILCLVAVIVLYGIITSQSKAQVQSDVKDLFVKELAHRFIGGDKQFLQLPDEQGWLGVVLVPPGTSLAALSEPFDGTTGEVLKSVSTISTFDQPIFTQGGYAFFSPISLATTWDDFLRRATPVGEVNKRGVITDNTLHWLFASRTTLKPRGHVQYEMSQPSAYMRRYKDYESTFEILLAGKDNELWRLLPKLHNYRTFNQARQQVLSDWVRHGYKVEVETSLKQYQAYQNGAAWRAWANARTAFEDSQVPLTSGTQLATTFLLPPPTAWPEISSWIRSESRAASSLGPISFQASRIKVVRPWLQLDDLLRRTFTLNTTIAHNRGYVLSDGQEPNFDSLGSGTMKAFIEELILVRNVWLAGSGNALPLGDHPLSALAYPDAINLAAYIVRVLPALPETVAGQ